MIHVEQQGSVLAIRMSRSFFGRPFWWTTAYWVDGLLIDTGPSFAAKALCHALSKLPVDQIVLTHTHENQIGGLPKLHSRYPNATIYAPRRALLALEQPNVDDLQLYRRVLWGAPQPWTGAVTLLEEVDDRLETSGGHTFRVIETPGHTPDHIALFEPTQRLLFSGDIFAHGEELAWAPEADLFGVICSLRTLANLHPERLFPSDGRISRTPIPELHGKIGELIHLAREVARMDALGLTSDEILQRLFRKEPPIHFWTMGHYSARHLIDACRSYNAMFMPVNSSDDFSTAGASHLVGGEVKMRNAESDSDTEDGEDSSDSSANWPLDWSDLIR